MSYTKVFEPMYINGWQDLPLETTPITAEALDNYDDAIEHIEDYLEDGGGGGTGGFNITVIAEAYDSTKTYNINDFCSHEGKLYKCLNNSITGEWDSTDWQETTLTDDILPLNLNYPGQGDYLSFSSISNAWENNDINYKANNTMIASIQGARASRAFAVGEYIIRNSNKFCRVTAATAEDAQWVKDTNYVETTVGEEIASGGGSGSVVAISPTLQSGTKIADFSIDGVAGVLYAPNGGGGSSTFAGLTDVDIDAQTLTNGQVPKYNSQTGKWENANESGGGSSTLGGLTDVNIATPSDGQFLVYDGTNNKWINQTIASAESESF